jgi:hypothetical protein
MARARPATAHQRLVTGEFAAPADEDGRPAGKREEIGTAKSAGETRSDSRGLRQCAAGSPAFFHTFQLKRARYDGLLFAEGHLNRGPLDDMLRRIWALPLPSG